MKTIICPGCAISFDHEEKDVDEPWDCVCGYESEQQPPAVQDFVNNTFPQKGLEYNNVNLIDYLQELRSHL